MTLDSPDNRDSRDGPKPDIKNPGTRARDLARELESESRIDSMQSSRRVDPSHRPPEAPARVQSQSDMDPESQAQTRAQGDVMQRARADLDAGRVDTDRRGGQAYQDALLAKRPPPGLTGTDAAIDDDDEAVKPAPNRPSNRPQDPK